MGSVLLLGATGSIGRATAQVLLAEGHDVVAPVRSPAALACAVVSALTVPALAKLMTQHKCDAVVSCIASRSGVPKDAWAIDHDLNAAALEAAITAGVGQFVLLSAICVQRPKLAFQQAKLAFEGKLQAADITWSIVRPTAFFKSLSGQLGRVQSGKPFVLFGDGQLTACKPISDRDVGRYLALCLTDATLHNRILPIGGPGPAITPRTQGEMLFAAAGKTPKFKHVPVWIMSGIIAVLSGLGRLAPRLRDKAELARIGRYYATESMLVWDAEQNQYDAPHTPEYGTDTLAAHYTSLVQGQIADDRGAHKVF